MATPPFLPDETKPGSSDLISLYPNVEQTFRDVIEDWILTEHNTTGTHKQVTLDDISEPTIAADLVGLWHESGVLKTRFATGTVVNVFTTAGGTLTGDLTLAGVPDADLKAATKKYVDDADALKANLASPALTGNPTAPTQTVGNDSTRIATTAFVQNAGSFGNALLHVRDEKTDGTDGGDFTLGGWRKRDLLVKATDEISGASVSSSVITLPAGTYYVEARAPAHKAVSRHKAKLRNTSESTDTIIGTSEFVQSTDDVQSVSFVSGRFTIADTKNFELQHKSSGTQNTTGFGKASNLGVIEVYSEIKIWKVG